MVIKHLQDLVRIQRVCLEHGYKIDLITCSQLWEEFSNGVSANWMFLPKEDDTLWGAIEDLVVVYYHHNRCIESKVGKLKKNVSNKNDYDDFIDRLDSIIVELLYYITEANSGETAVIVNAIHEYKEKHKEKCI